MGLLVFLAIAAVVGWGYRVPIAQGVWYGLSSRPLSATHQEALLRCESPGWIGLLRALEVDAEVKCGAGWTSRQLADGLNDMRAAWLMRFAEHPGKPSRSRLYAGLALLESGREPPRGLGLLLGHPGAPHAELEHVLDALFAAGEEPDWLDPRLRDGLVTRRLAAGDFDASADASDLLRIRAALALPMPDDGLTADALELSGFGGGRLERLAARGNMGFQEIPWPVARRLAPRVHECADPKSASCARLAADLLDQSRAEDRPDGGEIAPTLAADPLWDVLFAGDHAVRDAAARRFARQAVWIGAVEGPERTGRLLGSIAHPEHGYDAAVARLGLTGDPLYALAHRRATPWTTALAALMLGELAQAPVTVESVGDGVVLGVDGRRVGIGPCGSPLPVPPTAGTPWPRRAIVAQAAIEAAGAALRRNDDALARQLAALAERLDPIGAAGVRSVVGGVRPLPEDPTRVAGRLAGGFLAPAAVATSGADAERSQRAATWPHALADWNSAPDGCPAPLGP